MSLAADRLWAEGTAEAARVYNVADSRGMEAGPSKWIADVYNTSSWQYAVLVVAVMALMGLLLGYGTDRLLRLLRLNLGPLDHHE
ncbi:MAG TPA: hypothetical protein PKM94_10615 [candidate division Zixibacteria bacterium]|nr:hypothetical protein [candidate division Zixibacteria bacterium]